MRTEFEKATREHPQTPRVRDDQHHITTILNSIRGRETWFCRAGRTTKLGDTKCWKNKTYKKITVLRHYRTRPRIPRVDGDGTGSENRMSRTYSANTAPADTLRARSVDGRAPITRNNARRRRGAALSSFSGGVGTIDGQRRQQQSLCGAVGERTRWPTTFDAPSGARPPFRHDVTTGARGIVARPNAASAKQHRAVTIAYARTENTRYH